MAAPARVFTIARVAQIIRYDEQLLWDLAINMQPTSVFGSMIPTNNTRWPSRIAGWNICRNWSPSISAATRLRSCDQISCGHSDIRIDALMT
jgi:hypothetical protein